MPDKSKDLPKIPDDPDGRALGKARAAERVAAALRENLKRRKAQERALAAVGSTTAATAVAANAAKLTIARTIDVATARTGAGGGPEPE